MPDSSFVHLHLHTEYSLLDSSIRIKELMRKVKAFDMPAVGMTDHGNLYGAVEFFQEAEKSGVHPIIGCEIYVTPGSMLDKKSTAAKEFHLTLLCETNTGYQNLVKLVSAAHLEGFLQRPRVDHECLARHSEGIIALSGCQKGEIHTHLTQGRREEARETVVRYREIFGADRFFIELQDHGLEAQRRNNPELIRLAKEFGLGIVATNDVHFLERSHHEAHDVLICIGTGANIHDEKRLSYPPEMYFKSPEEMAALFRDHPEALENTLLIADRCKMKLEFGVNKYPAYTPPPGFTVGEYLRKLCYEGLTRRYGERAESDHELRTRLEYELSIIEKTGFISYFLIVWDFIHHAKSKGIPVGPGRGSAAGSLIAYCLGITDLDPLRYGLIFERFLNPERVSPPDIDVDFCMDRRGEVIEYVRQKYGERAVSQIITFGTLGAKSVVRDVARVLGWSYTEADRLAKLIPGDLNITLADAEEKNPELKSLIQSDSGTRQLWDYAVVLEGLCRNTGIHAAGVVIGDRSLDEYIPLCRGKDNEIVTQYEMGPLTDLGMLKMDFLGLKTLTVIEDAARMIREKQPDFEISTIPLDDQEAFDILNRGETVGVFQVEGAGITSCCQRFDVRSIDDIIAILALYRPGPMQFIPDYIARKKGEQNVHYAHPLLEKVCADTYGIIVYQEQVQRAANVLAGYSLGQADLLRRAMGKKDKEKMAKERVNFVEGCKKTNGIPEDQANAIFDFIAKFAEYGFNKSHSAAYGLLSYQTAWLKAHHPVEFMAALMSNDLDKTAKISVLIAECRRMGITVLPPDINQSALKFQPCTHRGKPAIRFGLAAIKNVGTGAVDAALREREKAGPFSSLADFCARLDSRSVNRKTIESLVKCGAFDCFGHNRASLFAAIEQAMSAATQVQRDRASGQGTLFDTMDFGANSTNSGIPELPPWPRDVMLNYEKELLGFYVTGHPLDDYAGSMESSAFRTIASLEGVEGTELVKLGGLILSVEKKFSRKDNRPMASFVLEDFTDSIELTAWSEVLTKYGDLLVPGAAVAVTARAHRVDENMLRLNVQSLEPLKKRATRQPVEILLDHQKLNEQVLETIASALRKHSGKRPVNLVFQTREGHRATLRTGKKFCVGDESAVRELLRREIPDALVS